jgi:cystathionine beta-lyase/cystathionine gamma-synthase
MTLKSTSDKGLQTLSIHAGETPDSASGASAPSLVMSSTFVVDEEVSFSANNLTSDSPFVYTRWDNPTTQQLEQKLAILEQAEACIAFASGMAASAAVLLSHLSQGDHLVISNTNYPGTAEFARDTLTRLGIEVTPVDTSELSNIENAMRDNTRMVWLETPSNPLLRISDIGGAAAIAHAQNALLAVDSTFASPIATRPLALGADLVVHSLTKYIGGHGDAMGGSVCGSQALLGALRGEALVHYGGVISPFNAWLIALPRGPRQGRKSPLPGTRVAPATCAREESDGQFFRHDQFSHGGPETVGRTHDAATRGDPLRGIPRPSPQPGLPDANRRPDRFVLPSRRRRTRQVPRRGRGRRVPAVGRARE